MDINLIPAFKDYLQIDLPGNISSDELRMILASHINRLIQTDFQKLVSILYRLDVSESKLRNLLKEHHETDAGLIIAGLMIEREKEKIQSRRQFDKRDENINDDEKW